MHHVIDHGAILADRVHRKRIPFGTPVSVRGPRGTDDSYALTASPAGNSIDIVGTFGSAAAGTASIFYTRLEPGTSVSSRGITVRAGRRVTLPVRVADAGRPLAGALVTVVGRASNARSHRRPRVVSARTDRHGVARLRVGPFEHSMSLRLRVTKRGYATSWLSVRVRVSKRR
jgi:hypothetical protein